MKSGIRVRAVAAGAFALAAAGLAVAGCSHSPQPVTGQPRQQAAAGGKTTTHSSEAEPKAAPAAAAKAAAASPASSPAGAGPPPLVTANTAAPAASPPPAAAAAAAGPAADAARTPAGAAAATAPAPASASPGAAAAAVPIAPGGAPARYREAANDPTLIVVDQADYDPAAPLSLAEAAKAERERKAEAVPPRIIINNKTLHRYAKGGQLTVAAPQKQPASPAAKAAASAEAAAGTTLARDEAYWRGRALEIRQRWRKAYDRVKALEQDISEWRRRFYAQDDPVVRDGQIKPAWDRALDELRESRATVKAAKKELADFLEEGRIAGALPGWLREGVDQEPKEEKPVDPLQPVETPIYKDSGP